MSDSKRVIEKMDRQKKKFEFFRLLDPARGSVDLDQLIGQQTIEFQPIPVDITNTRTRGNMIQWDPIPVYRRGTVPNNLAMYGPIFNDSEAEPNKKHPLAIDDVLQLQRPDTEQVGQPYVPITRTEMMNRQSVQGMTLTELKAMRETAKQQQVKPHQVTEENVEKQLTQGKPEGLVASAPMLESATAGKAKMSEEKVMEISSTPVLDRDSNTLTQSTGSLNPIGNSTVNDEAQHDLEVVQTINVLEQALTAKSSEQEADEQSKEEKTASGVSGAQIQEESKNQDTIDPVDTTTFPDRPSAANSVLAEDDAKENKVTQAIKAADKLAEDMKYSDPTAQPGYFQPTAGKAGGVNQIGLVPQGTPSPAQQAMQNLGANAIGRIVQNAAAIGAVGGAVAPQAQPQQQQLGAIGSIVQGNPAAQLQGQAADPSIPMTEQTAVGMNKRMRVEEHEERTIKRFKPNEDELPEDKESERVAADNPRVMVSVDTSAARSQSADLGPPDMKRFENGMRRVRMAMRRYMSTHSVTYRQACEALDRGDRPQGMAELRGNTDKVNEAICEYFKRHPDANHVPSKTTDAYDEVYDIWLSNVGGSK